MSTLALGCCNDCCGVGIEQVVYELIGMLCLDTQRPQCAGRKVLLIEGHDDTGTAAQGGRQDMTIIGIW
ncbi:hypothetical protein D3C81_1838040 [compost metagenome]